MKLMHLLVAFFALSLSTLVKAETYSLRAGIKTISGELAAPGVQLSLNPSPLIHLDLAIYNLIAFGALETGIRYVFEDQENEWKPSIGYRIGLDYAIAHTEFYQALYFGVRYQKYFIELAPTYVYDAYNWSKPFVNYSAIIGIYF